MTKQEQSDQKRAPKDAESTETSHADGAKPKTEKDSDLKIRYYVIKNNKNQYFTRTKWTHEGWVDTIEEAEIFQTLQKIEDMTHTLNEISQSLDQYTTAQRVEVKVSEQGKGVQSETIEAKELREREDRDRRSRESVRHGDNTGPNEPDRRKEDLERSHRDLNARELNVEPSEVPQVKDDPKGIQYTRDDRQAAQQEAAANDESTKHPHDPKHLDEKHQAPRTHGNPSGTPRTPNTDDQRKTNPAASGSAQQKTVSSDKSSKR